ncbi:hypothetical protein [Aeromonas finlandensis]|uniref:hypothetical protein n=1 Tax=Aeromonas finlandensis TaxID=1543375 RepID=UPI00051C80DF|nr:hypothetical protein [Aeromonas finlandensis]
MNANTDFCVISSGFGRYNAAKVAMCNGFREKIVRLMRNLQLILGERLRQQVDAGPVSPRNGIRAGEGW